MGLGKYWEDDMIKEFKDYNKLCDYISWKFENKFAVIGAVLVAIVMVVGDFYNDLYSESSVCTDFLMMVIPSNIAAIALVFTGVAFWGELFDKRLRQEIKEAIGEKALSQMYISYLFLAVNLLANTVCDMCVIILVRSNLATPPKVIVYIFITLYIYWFFFIWGYFVSLISNCVRLIRAKNKLEEIDKPTLYDKANEVRVDYLLDCVFKNIDSPELEEMILSDLDKYTEAIDDKEMQRELKEYFNNYYSR